MSISTYLQKEQPLFYQIINHAFNENKVNHAYLFIGENTRLPISYLSMALLCDKDIKACEVCNTCRRVKDNLYADIIHLNGKYESIKKQDILQIQSQFSKSSLENKAKIYIIENIENATIEALNTLLKMLEEPVKDTYAIFSTNNKNALLPTITSRCQIIDILPGNFRILQEDLIKKGITKSKAIVLSRLTTSIDEAMSIDYKSLDYFIIQAMHTVTDICNNRENLIINAYVNILHKFNKKEDLQYFLMILAIVMKDMFHVKHNLPVIIEDHKEYLEKLMISDTDIIVKMEAILHAQFQLSTNANTMLVMDELLSKL